MDALDFLKMLEDNSVDGILYDPPFSPRQVSECYKDFGYNVTWDTTKATFWGNQKKEIKRILKVGGKVITFGWNSGGIDKTNGFEITLILMVPHGGWHNDTICTVEIKKERFKMRKLKIIDEELIKEFSNLPEGFWDFKNDDTKELTHSIHNYPAVMIYPISRNILSIVNKYRATDTLFDPFMGSGTVLLEGLLAGCSNIYGNDLNPLAQKISKAKTTLIKTDIDKNLKQFTDKLQAQYESNALVLDGIDSYIKKHNYDITAKINDKTNWGANACNILNDYLSESSSDLEIPNIQNMGFWFVPRCIIELQIIRNLICEISDADLRDYFMLAFSETTRLVSNRRNGEFKMYRMQPEKVASYKPDVKAIYLATLSSNISKMKDLINRVGVKTIGTVHLSHEDSRVLNSVPDDSIDIVITSPPYGDSRTTVAYGQFSRVSLQWCDFDSLTYKEIIDIDKNLLGGTPYKKGFENNLKSASLKKALSEILNNPDNLERAGDVYSFYKDLNDVLKVVTQKCKNNAYQFWVVGNRTVKEVFLNTDQILVELGENLGLKHIMTMNRTISNKVMPSLNSPTNKAGKKVKTMCEELIVVFRKE